MTDKWVKMWEITIADNKIKFFDKNECELLEKHAHLYHHNCKLRYNDLAFRTDDGMLEASKIIESLENSRPILRSEFSYEELNYQLNELMNGSEIISTISDLLSPGFDLNYLKAKLKLDCFDTLIYQFFNNDYFTESERYNIKTEASNLFFESEDLFKSSSKFLEKDDSLSDLLKIAYNSEICSEMVGINARFVNLLWISKNPDFYLEKEYEQFLDSSQKGQYFFKKSCDKNIFLNENSFGNIVADYIQLMYYSINQDNINELKELLNFIKIIDGSNDGRYQALNENFKVVSKNMNLNIFN